MIRDLLIFLWVNNIITFMSRNYYRAVYSISVVVQINKALSTLYWNMET